jgi:hypothetical protein
MRSIVVILGALLLALVHGPTGLVDHGGAALLSEGHFHGQSHAPTHHHYNFPICASTRTDGPHSILHCGDHGNRDEHHCCHTHHHEHDGADFAIAPHHRDPVPDSTGILAAAEVWRSIAVPREHRQHWPFARARPPDHLVCLRTVVMLT